MNAQILEALLAIIKTGGTFSLWGISIWLIMGLIKTFLIGFFVMKTVAMAFKGYKLVLEEVNNARVNNATKT